METLKPVIEELVKLVQGTKAFALDQAPDFVKQVVLSGIIENSGWVAWGIAMGVVAYFLYRKVKQNWDEGDGLVAFFGTIVIFALVMVSAWNIISGTDYLLKIWLAPKAYIVKVLMK